MCSVSNAPQPAVLLPSFFAAIKKNILSKLNNPYIFDFNSSSISLLNTLNSNYNLPSYHRFIKSGFLTP
jgi:hypothetical protein